MSLDLVHRDPGAGSNGPPDDLVSLAQPVLALLQSISGFGATFLATWDTGLVAQEIRCAHSHGALQVPIGEVTPWVDTLCGRLHEAGELAVDDVQARWPDAKQAARLGIRAYASAPIVLSNGQIVGSLCAADVQARALAEPALGLLPVFAQLLAMHLEREQLMSDLARANRQLAELALQDSLTGLPNRRALTDAFGRLRGQAQRDGAHLIVGVIDLDGFKAINDRHGHQAGDQLLQVLALRLQRAVRAADLVGRLGGDEFAVFGLGPGNVDEARDVAAGLQERLTLTSLGELDVDGVLIPYGGASVGVVAVPSEQNLDTALRWADDAMYEAKRRRRLTGI